MAYGAATRPLLMGPAPSWGGRLAYFTQTAGVPSNPRNHDEEAVMRLRAATVMAAVAALVAIAAPPALASQGAGPTQAQPAGAQLSAQIRYTTGGVPHILAHGWTSLGFGYGYA